METKQNNFVDITADNSSYNSWLKELKQRYLNGRLKASISVNAALLEFYWSLGRDIEAKQYNNTYGSGFYKNLSKDLQRELPDVKGLSENNIRYMYRFYMLYTQCDTNLLQPIEDSINMLMPNLPQTAEDFTITMLFSIPWEHHRRIIDHCKNNTDKAIFFVKKTLENNWSRDVLLNWLDTDLYEREGKAITNFKATLPALQGDLAQQITKDPYNFDFLTMRERYDERELEDALVANVTKFLLELGKGFSYMGRQFRLSVGDQEFFPDLLFYNAHLHTYIVIELKVKSFQPEFLGQLSFYVSAINNQFKTEVDNPTIGLLICKDKDNVVAKYALDGYNQPIGISEYQLTHLFPEDFKSTLPSIEEIEKELNNTKE